jgi:hypothetical protein
MDDMFNAWRCGSCTYQNLGKAKGACNMCNDPHPIWAGLSLDPWEIGELEARSLRQVAASPPPDDKTPSDECHARQFCVSKSNDPNHFTICIDCNGDVHMVCADLLFFQKPARTVSSPRRICRNTRRCDCVRCHWLRGSLCTSVSSAKTELFDRGHR